MTVTIASIVWAGQMWKTRCEECEYSDTFIDNGVRLFTTINGACGTCKKIVTIKFDRSKDVNQKPKPVVIVWDSLRNRNIKIFTCPHCEGHFIEIEKVKLDLKYCAACKKGKIELLEGPMAD